MKIRLFQELLALNQEFGHVIHDPEQWRQSTSYTRAFRSWPGHSCVGRTRPPR